MFDSIKMDLREIGWDGMDSVDLSQDTSTVALRVVGGDKKGSLESENVK
jgi:hypothetical protein